MSHAEQKAKDTKRTSMQLLYMAGQALSGQHSFRISERMPLKEERVLSVGTIVQCSLYLPNPWG